MPQRPEDYQSTKNVGGNRTGGTDARTNDPFAYVKLQKEHAYLGHFRKDGFIRAGHNVSPVPPTISDPFPTPPPVVAPPLAPPIDSVAASAPQGNALATPLTRFQREHPVTAVRRATQDDMRSVRLAGRAGVLQARASGGDVAAARAAKRASIADAQAQRQQVIDLARLNPESARSERQARAAGRQATAAAVAPVQETIRNIRQERRSTRMTNQANRLLRRAGRLSGGI